MFTKAEAASLISLKNLHDEVKNIDAKCVFLCMKYELDHMCKQNGGAIVNTSSISGLSAKPDNMLPYIAAKHAVIGRTRLAAFNHAKEGIRVNTIASGLIETEMTGLNPMNAAGKPIEIANVVLFLCSDPSRFTTAAVVSVDGGQAAL
jgi:NAD(P)-dependent dehydrogenase (short-subunit alcohol dehydrogenase family)